MFDHIIIWPYLHVNIERVDVWAIHVVVEGETVRCGGSKTLGNQSGLVPWLPRWRCLNIHIPTIAWKCGNVTVTETDQKLKMLYITWRQYVSFQLLQGECFTLFFFSFSFQIHSDVFATNILQRFWICQLAILQINAKIKTSRKKRNFCYRLL